MTIETLERLSTERIVPARTPTPETALRELRDVEGMERFTKREKDVMILKHACMMSIEEIADHLGLSYQTVANALSAAKRKCEENQ